MLKPAIVYSPQYKANIGSHVFPMEKYALISELLSSTGIREKFEWFTPAPANLEDLLLVHTKEFIDSFFAVRMDKHTIPSELPLTQEIVDAYLLMTGGTIMAAELALDRGRAANIGGGFHHAMADHAEGFCYINDMAVAIRVLMKNKRINRSLVVDCDLHQGNGTAKIFQNEPRVFTFSIHQENLYPIKETSSLDIGLADFTRDEEYLFLLNDALKNIFTRFVPDIVIYQAGADPYEQDQLGLLRITKEGLAKRDKSVYETCSKKGVPVVTTLGGGYAIEIEDTVVIHYNSIKLLADQALFAPSLNNT